MALNIQVININVTMPMFDGLILDCLTDIENLYYAKNKFENKW